ncbi:MAG: nuclear transport factor 2 family protein [Solirubrobacterales bacterium]
MTAEEDLDHIRRSIDAWNRNDWEAMEASATPEISIVAPEGWPESGVFEGWPAVRRQYERLKGSWSDERIEVLALDPVGDDRVLAHLHWTGHGETSGLDLDLRTWGLNTLEDGRITRTEFFLDRDAAMRAADLGN